MSLWVACESLFGLQAAACSLVPPVLVLAELAGLSGVPAATLDRAFGNIDGFEFGFVQIGSKLRLAQSGKWSTEAASVHLADWPPALPSVVQSRILHLPMIAISSPILAPALKTGTNSLKGVEGASTPLLEARAHHERA